MKKSVLTSILLFWILAVIFTKAAQAHHGGGSYWQDRTVGPVSGTATSFSFSFPHIAFSLDITDEQGTLVNHRMTIRWTPTVLRKRGWTRRSIEVGDKLTVTFVPHKQDPAVGSVVSLEVNDIPLECWCTD